MVGSLSLEDFHTVIAHEFAHMRRNDFIKNLLYELLSLPVAYHPLLWLTQERITESREIVCDQLAAEISGRNEYAQSLLRLASLLVHGTSVRIPHAIGILDANIFERRLMKLTEGTKEMRGVRRVAAVLACAALGVATCGSALALRMDVNAPIADQDETAKTPKKVMIASGVMAGNKLSGDNPKYPVDAKKAKIQGTVVLEAVINKEGDVENLKVVSGPKELLTSALDAVKTWKYKPYMLNGDVIDVTTRINVTYSLGG
jgi:TonB family protein